MTRPTSADITETITRGRPCPICGAVMEPRHCKYVCPNHGIVYDCGDPFA